MNKAELKMNCSNLIMMLTILLGILPGAAGLEAEAAGPPMDSCRAGELIIRFRPGAVPAAPVLEAPAASAPGKPATPREAFAFTPAAKFSNPHRPASLKALDRRFGLREARPLGAPARLKTELPTKPGAKSSTATSANTAAPLAETWLLRLDPAADLNAALAAYRADPAVLYAEPNYEGALAFVPSDPLYSRESRNFKLIGLERAWDVRPGASRGVEVAVIDSGIDAAHPDLAGALDLAGSYNFADNNTRIYDDIGHGTRVAGVIGATAANGEGITGVAFGCRLMSLDVATSAGVITTANVASAIDWAVAKGAGVINLSLTFSAFSQTLSDACQAAVASGVVVVAAAGNENQGERPVYPASYNGVLGVGAIAADGKRAPWSNYNGTCAGNVDLVAPGEAVFSTIPNGQYNGSYGSGTSFATPMVSGVAALLKTRYPAQSGQAIAAHLLATAAPVSAAFGPPAGAGSGLLSAQNALATAMQPELALGPVTVDDTSTATSANDGNGRLARGEKAVLRVKLKNSGADIDLISAALTTTDPAITIGDGAGAWGAIKNGEEAGPSDPFANITVSPTATAHVTTFTLTLNITYNQSSSSTQNITFTIPVEATRTVTTGNYFSPQTWTSDQTWEIQGTQNFNAGLTIQPGTTVKVAPGVDININGGTLKAEGSQNKPILITGANPSQTATSGTTLGPHTMAVNFTDYQQIRYVSASTGSDSGGDGSSSHPWATLKGALTKITDASDSNRYALFIAEGTYAESGIQMKKGVDVYGGFSSNDWKRDITAHPTVLDGQGSSTAVQFDPYVNIRLDGFRICNGLDKSDSFPYGGGGITCVNASPVISNNCIVSNNSIKGCGGIAIIPTVSQANTSPTIENNFISNNKSTSNNGNGGGIFSMGGTARIAGNIITNNSVSMGGGIYLYGCKAVIDRNIIAGNLASGGYGGGILASYPGVFPTLTTTISNNYMAGNYGWENSIQIDNDHQTAFINNVIVDYHNSPYSTSGAAFYNSKVTMMNNTVLGNAGREINIYMGDVSVQNSIVYQDIADLWSGNRQWPLIEGGRFSYCNVQGGTAGAGNLNTDPQFIGIVCNLNITKIQFDPASGQSLLTNLGRTLPPNSLTGRTIELGASYLYVISNTEGTVTVWGDASAAGTLPLQSTVFDYHLKPGSPCIDAGDNTGVPQTDMVGAPRIMRGASALKADLGACEFDPGHPYTGFYWGRLYLKNAATNSSMSHCTVENGCGVLNDSGNTNFTQCLFQNNVGIGFESTSSSGAITSCTALANTGDGIKSPNLALTGCQASNNGGYGLIAGALFNCRVEANTLDGGQGSSATDCLALGNGGSGLNLSGLALRCTAQSNHGVGIQGTAQQCQTIQNGGAGIIGTATQCYVLGNGGGGISGSATDCQIIGNTGVGVSGSATLTRCLIRDNTGAAASGASVVDGCTITGNGSGLSVGTKITNSYVAANNGQGISGGAVQASTIVGNQGRGLLSPLSVADSWVMFNQGAGIETPLGNISNSSICDNTGYGILNPAGGKTVTNCNLYGNGTYEVYTNLNTASGGYPANTLDFRHNYWGPVTTPLLTANPFPSVNITRIVDLFDNNLAKGWYINYGGAGEFETAPVATAPGDKAPAFLLAVTPDAAHPLNIGPATFKLTFSRAMNTATPLSVTFGTAAPYATNVVAPAPGWLSPTLWQGSFAVQSDTAQGLNTLRVAGAVDATGFAIPDDTAHTFMIETSGKPSANNGLAIGHGIKMSLSWSEEDKPATAIGYNVLRSESGFPGTYVRCNAALLTLPSFEDAGLKPDTDYYYMVYLVDSGMNAVQWTPPFLGNTGESRAAVRDWAHYR